MHAPRNTPTMAEGAEWLPTLGLEARLRSRQRWVVAGLLVLVTALSYFDRQALPLLAGEIRKEIAIDNAAYARLNSMFLVTYGVMYAVGGRLLDVMGTRLGYTLMIAWWSAATLATGFVHSLRGLGACRLLLGIGEGGGFPGSSKAVAEWFSVKERSFAFGLFNLGSSIGAVIAAPVLAALVVSSGWRMGFLSVGSAGLAIAIA